jgi:hypothetical protein
MSDLLLSAKSAKPGSTEIVLISGETPTGYRLHDWDLGNVAWELFWSGQRGTQGARLAGAEPQNRPLVIDLRTTGSSPDDLAVKQSALARLADELRRFGGRVTVQHKGGSQRFHFDVRAGTTGVSDFDWAHIHRHTVIQRLEAWCAPYLEGDPVSVLSSASTDLPAVFSLSSIIGDARALAAVSVGFAASAAGMPWALIAWPKANDAFGIVEAEDEVSVSGGWSQTADGDYRGGSGLQVTAAGAVDTQASYAFDATLCDPDDYTSDEVAVEVWARVEIASTLVLPTLILKAQGAASPLVRYSREYGEAGKPLVLPSSGTRFRFVRLGTVVVSRLSAWSLSVQGKADAGSTGTLGLDYLIFVPPGARACGPTGKANDASYPDFHTTNSSAATRKIRSDLSGTTIVSGVESADQGLGGALLEIPPGDRELIVKLSSVAPDDPSSDTSSETLAHAATVAVTVTPRWHVARVA